MRGITLLFVPCVLQFLAAPPVAHSSDKALNVIASIPDLADIGREIGGGLVEISSLAKGVEDTHAVPVRPSHVAKLARADVLIELGLEMEHAWLPALVDASNNQKIRSGGRIVVSEGIVPLEVPTIVSRTEGEQHPSGNPHVNLNPGAGRIMAENICKGLSLAAPQHKAVFEANLAKYLEKLTVKEKEWKAAGEKLKGVKFVSYHNHWPYWAEYFGMTYVGMIERKPGIAPSGSHVAELIKRMKAEDVKIVVREPQYSENVPLEIGTKTGAKVVKLSILAGGTPDTATWIELIDSNLKRLLEAAGNK